MKRSFMWPKCTKPLGKGGAHASKPLVAGNLVHCRFSRTIRSTFSVLFSAPNPACAFNRLYGWFLKVNRYHILVNSQPRIMQF